MAPEGNRPPEYDVRGIYGVPTGTELRQPTPAQLRAIASLQGLVSGSLVVHYNGLTATPRHLFSQASYLSDPSSAPPEVIARNFLQRWGGIWRFNDADLQNLRLKSRATLQDTGTTVLLFEQQVNDVGIYKGEVLVNVNRAGQIISVGNDNYPAIAVTNSFSLTPAQAVTAAAAGLGVSGFSPQSLGTKEVLRTFGDLPHEFEQGARFSSGGAFSDEIVVTRVIFPLGDEGRAAYQLTITTPQYDSTMWDNIIDAETGAVLRRISLTSFHESGGGPQNSRRGTFRPDIQTVVETHPITTTGLGKTFDGAPSGMSGPNAFGRPTRAELPKQPGYAPDTATTTATGIGFRRGLVFGRNEFPFAEPGTPLFSVVNGVPFSQVTRGFPDASNPTPESPFGWFYLPTGSDGAEITVGDANRGATRALGYNMHAAARTRNQVNPGNSPDGDGTQPFSADLAAIPTVTLRDGRTLPAVFESRYTEGNNAFTADDKDNDNETTHGIKGYATGRNFTAPYFDFSSTYEIDGQANPDVFPATLALFYYNNVLHDYLYSIGFTEATWNFQEDNFGKGGAGRDAVSTQVQDGAGTNNANFSTPSDGSRPRMQMYLFTDGTFRRADGDLDFDVVAHELYHGVSNRSVGKGTSGCLGVTQVGEANGMGEGWSDYIANSMADDDVTGEYATGRWDIAIRKLPNTNFRYSYRNITGTLSRRDQQPPDTSDTRLYIPFQVHDVGEHWSSTLWDMRELLIMKQDVDDGPGFNFPGMFFDGTRRTGGGTSFFMGYRQVQSVDTRHPIDYRASFNSASPATIKPSEHIVRPGAVAAEIQALGHRNGPLATAVKRGGRLADVIVLRGMQLAPCQPSFVDMRDSMLLADRELTGGENQAVIWRAFASHGVGVLATSTNASADTTPGTQNTPVIVEDFSVPAGVTQCEQLGPLPPPAFGLSNTSPNQVVVTITPVLNAASYVISRANSAEGPFIKIAEIPGSQNTYVDNAGGDGLVLGQTYHYQVRATRNPQCVSSGNTSSITITVGGVLQPAPVFFGAAQVGDPRVGNRLIVSWSPATSVSPTANIVYDIYRVAHIDHGTGQNEPTFTPSNSNRIAQGVTGTSFTDTGLTLNQVYYYIVQAQDLDNGKIDTNNTGNRIARWSAPTITCVTGTPPFALETFEAASANTRFAPPLTEAGTNPNQASPTVQRITVAGLGHPSVGKMYLPNYSPCHEVNPSTCQLGGGAQSDFYSQIGPLALSPTSIMEFDQTINSEDRFDGGVLEIKVGSPFIDGEATPFPDNVVTFDLGDYMIEGGYNSALDGTLNGVPLSALLGRRSFSGNKPLHHVRVSLRSFAPGGVHNPSGLPVYIRFRETSDAATSPGVDSGRFVDNLVINNMGASGTLQLEQVVSRKTHGAAGTFDLPLPLTGTRAIECRTGGENGDHTMVFRFGAPVANVGSVSVTQGTGTVSSVSEGETSQELVVNLTRVGDAQTIVVTVGNVTDACGNNVSSISVPMDVLLGDTTNNGAVNASDVGQAKAESGQTATASNFRVDVNVSGAINATDVSLIKSRSGTSLQNGRETEPDGSTVNRR